MKTIFDENKYFKKCDMISINLENTHKYLKIQQSLLSEIFFLKFYIQRNIFTYFVHYIFTSKHIPRLQNKIDHGIN